MVDHVHEPDASSNCQHCGIPLPTLVSEDRGIQILQYSAEQLRTLTGTCIASFAETLRNVVIVGEIPPGVMDEARALAAARGVDILQVPIFRAARCMGKSTHMPIMNIGFEIVPKDPRAITYIPFNEPTCCVVRDKEAPIFQRTTPKQRADAKAPFYRKFQKKKGRW